MTGYQFALTCPHCAALMAHTCDGSLTPKATCALATCTACGTQVRVDVRVSVLSGPALRESLRPRDVVVRDPFAPGAALIDAPMDAGGGK